LPSFAIPYQPQAVGTPDHMCGAAALAMVYASLGVRCAQEEIWPAIRQPSARGAWTTRTHRLARHAVERGFAALVVQAGQPWTALARCWEHEVRVIVNHRVRRDSRLGHFSVLAGIGPQEVLLHDPQFGPAQRHSRPAFLQLWLPTAGQSEIAGNVLVAIGRGEASRRASASCTTCGTAIPAAIPCAGCGEAIGLAPAAALGCLRPDCPARIWRYLFCPACDRCRSVADPSGAGS